MNICPGTKEMITYIWAAQVITGDGKCEDTEKIYPVGQPYRKLPYIYLLVRITERNLLPVLF